MPSSSVIPILLNKPLFNTKWVLGTACWHETFVIHLVFRFTVYKTVRNKEECVPLLLLSLYLSWYKWLIRHHYSCKCTIFSSQLIYYICIWFAHPSVLIQAEDWFLRRLNTVLLYYNISFVSLMRFQTLPSDRDNPFKTCLIYTQQLYSVWISLIDWTCSRNKR